LGHAPSEDNLKMKATKRIVPDSDDIGRWDLTEGKDSKGEDFA